MKAFYNIAFLLLLLVTHSAKASIIDYRLTALGGNSYQYDYIVTNDGSLGPGVEIEWFAIQFDPALYDQSSLTIVTPEPLASDWDQLILGSGLLVPATYDVLTFSSGIAEGSSVAGFAVQFNWLGAGLPGSQSFEVYDPATNDLIEQGITTTTVVPIPSAFVMFLTSLLGIGSFNVKRRLIG
jgi:hypothetical protein